MDLNCPRRDCDAVFHVSRGTSINNVLNGSGHFETVQHYSDAADGAGDDNLEYDPENDFRLDKFDGLEYATQRMENELEAKRNQDQK